MQITEQVDRSGQAAVLDARRFGAAELIALVLGVLLLVAGLVLGLGFTGGVTLGTAAGSPAAVTLVTAPAALLG